MIISCPVILGMTYVLDRKCRENQSKFYRFSNLFFFPEIRAVCEICGRNMVQTDSLQMVIWGRMRFARWIAKTTNTHSEYVILIAFPPQQMLHENASLLRHKNTAYLFLVIFEYKISDAEIKKTNFSPSHILTQILIYFRLQLDRRSSTPRFPLQSGGFFLPIFEE